MITFEQLEQLKEMDIPYCPSAFNYLEENFRKYIKYMRLPAYRPFKWEDSQELEELEGEIWKKLIKYKENEE